MTDDNRTLTSPSQTKLFTALLPGNPTVLGMARKWFHVRNIKYRSAYIYQKLVSQPTENRQTTGRLKTTAPNPKHCKKAHKKHSHHQMCSLLAEPKQMVRAESTNTCIAGIDTLTTQLCSHC